MLALLLFMLQCNCCWCYYFSASTATIEPSTGKGTQALDVTPSSVLILTPMKNAERHMDRYIVNLLLLAYPKHLLSWACIISDSTDGTVDRANLHANMLKDMQGWRRAQVFVHDFNAGLEFAQRHQITYQKARRSLLARARNMLLKQALRDEQWVLWMDSDVSTVPSTLLADLIAYNKDVLVPNCMYKDEDHILQPYDLNSWQETSQSERIHRILSPDFLMMEGYPDIHSYHKQLGGMYNKTPEEIVPLDGVGASVLLLRASLVHKGLHFPEDVFQHQIESEALGKLAIQMGYQPHGLPHYVVLHW